MVSIPSGGGQSGGVGDIVGPVTDLNKAVGKGEGAEAEGEGAPAEAPSGGASPDPITGGLLGQAQKYGEASAAQASNTVATQQANTADAANDLSGMSQDIAKGADGKEPPPSGDAVATNDAIAGSTTQ